MKVKGKIKQIYKMRWYYLLIFPTIAYFVIFHYIPMYGITLAFKDYIITKGIIDSPWVGFDNFERLFNSIFFHRVFVNTLLISLYKLLFGFPAPIILALLLNEVSNAKFKKFAQTVSYLPHFISWVILSGIFIEILSPSRGAVNYMLTLFGKEPIYFLSEAKYFRSILVVTNIYNTVGWGSIVYLAAISGIDPQLYDAAYIDGANRFQIIKRIIIPTIMPVVSIVFILNLGKVLNAGFDQVFNMYNPMVYSTGDIIDTYVYRIGIVEMKYSFSTAVGLFKNVIGFLLVVMTNTIVRNFKSGENALW